MNQKLKLIGGNLVMCVLIMVLLETICYLLLPTQHKGIGFLINTKSLFTKVEVSPQNGFDEVDPLLGWARTNEKLKALGFTTESGNIVLTTSDDTAGRINILITGGSTSDLANEPHNWPVDFCKILKGRGIKAKLYCEGTGGYNSGQELLKLIRDGQQAQPWLHISYSGANEIFNQSYVSAYEDNFYRAELGKGASPWLLPNTIMLFNSLLNKINPAVVLRTNETVKPEADFWETNMRLMHGISVEYNYHFIGFLQPVLGAGKYQEKVEGHDSSLAQYRQLFPAFKQAAAQYPDFIFDFTPLFDTCKGRVFKDNCHIEDAYQPLVAQSIYDALVKKGVLADSALMQVHAITQAKQTR